jgi:hypothetical protein
VSHATPSRFTRKCINGALLRSHPSPHTMRVGRGPSATVSSWLWSDRRWVCSSWSATDSPWLLEQGAMKGTRPGKGRCCFAPKIPERACTASMLT